MEALPCLAFTPMYVHGHYHCARCGLTLDYHKAYSDHDMIFIPNVTNNHDHQLHHDRLINAPQCPEPAVFVHEVVPYNNLHDLPMEIMLLQPQPAEPNHQTQLDMNNMVNNNNNDGNGALPAIRSWVFSEYQIVQMFAMAGRYQWSLRGHSRNEELHQFCNEIGVTWTQFSNWVHRNRARFGSPGNNYSQLG